MVTVVVGGQFGSEGKGAVAAHLHRSQKYDWAIRVGGPNAGHTVVGRETGEKYALRQIPVAAVADKNCDLLIAAGSEVDLEVLESEVRRLEQDGYKVKGRLYVHHEATVLEEGHRQIEAGLESGSTHKGIGAARAARALRKAKRVLDVPLMELQGLREFEVEPRGDCLIEGTQGYELGSHAGYYPFCTSGDCRAIDFLAQAGFHPFRDVEVWVVLRTYPIRIAGNSGPLASETSWDKIGVNVEYTTVTKKVRRVGEWNGPQAKRAVLANGGNRVKVALTFVDYWWPQLRSKIDDSDLGEMEVRELALTQREIGAPIELLGTGPDSLISIPGGFAF